MGTKTIIFCDLCGSEKAVKTNSVVYGWESDPHGKSEDVQASADLCPNCADNIEWAARHVADVSAPGKPDDRFRTSLAALYHVASCGVLRLSAKTKDGA